jgi:hypothetical protein
MDQEHEDYADPDPPPLRTRLRELLSLLLGPQNDRGPRVVGVVLLVGLVLMIAIFLLEYLFAWLAAA